MKKKQVVSFDEMLDQIIEIKKTENSALKKIYKSLKKTHAMKSGKG